MKGFGLGRSALSGCIAAAALAGCGGLQSPFAAMGAMPQTANAEQSAEPLNGQNFRVIYTFTGGADGSGPHLFTTLTMNAAGDLFGAAAGGTGSGCDGACGVVYEMTPAAKGKWTESVLFDFSGYYVDGEPVTSVAMDGKGDIFGGAIGGKQGYGDLVYELTPGRGGWSYTNVHDPGTSVGLIADAQGKNFYAPFGDSIGDLSPAGSGWKITTLYEFCPGGWKCVDGDRPLVPLSWDAKGNLYGTTYSGGLVNFKECGGYCGVAFEMARNRHGAWKYHVLHRFGSFNGDGVVPYGQLTVDASGNVFGTTTHWGPHERGTVFKLTPTRGGRWRETVLYGFPAQCNCDSPGGNLVLDKTGNVYGTAATFQQCLIGGNGCGLVFKLAPQKRGRWKFSVEHLFRGPDGEFPNGLTLDSAGRLYGTTMLGGEYDLGVVFEIRT